MSTWGDDFGFSAWAACCGPGFRHRAGRKGRRRMFGRGDLKYAVLSLLSERPMHGYEVMQRLESESGFAYSASAGSVYPVLQMLQDQGYVESEERDGKRVYRLTESGAEFLQQNRDRVEDVFDRVTGFGERLTGRGMRELTGAFVRLAQVSFERAMQVAGDPAAVAAVREILERATRDMESGLRGHGATQA